MRELSYHDFTAAGRGQGILEGTVNLTYRCNLRCIHCFTDCSFNHSKELSLGSWKKIIDQLYESGCLWLTISGGEPLLYEDFLPLYLYACKKGMKVTVFTNATLLSSEVIRAFTRHRPFMVEVSLYARSRRVHEAITGVRGSFSSTITHLRALAGRGIPVIVKAVGLRQNRQEVSKLKSFSEKLLGKGRFKFDSFIQPRLNGDTSVCRYRLSPAQIIAIEARHPEMVGQRLKELDAQTVLPRPACFLYQCAARASSFFIEPDGRLKICTLSPERSFDLGTVSFKAAFERGVRNLRRKKFRTDSKCQACALRGYCYFCPARALLETRDAERGSSYFCRLAKARKKQYEAFALSRSSRE
jgi:radical SAM protein with 4Fe4S-binding SPASM domain